MYEIKALREKRAKLHEDAKGVLKIAHDEKRELTTEERTKVDATYAEVDKIKGDVDRLERAAVEEKARADSAGRKTETRIANPEQLTRGDWNRMFRAWASYGSRAANEADIEFARKVGFNPSIQEIDARAPTVTPATQGGNVVADEPMRSYYEVQKWFGAVRDVAQLIQTETGGEAPAPPPDANAGLR